MATEHRFRFFRAGGFDQVQLQSGEDILALESLDKKLWVALSCPTHGLEIDEKTLDLVDTDKDGRIRPPELLEAVRWAGQVLHDADDLRKRSAKLPLAAIDEEDEEGKILLASAKQILVDLGKKDAKEINLSQLLDTAKIFAQTKFNGDGIVPPSSASDAFTEHVIEDIVACIGGETDRSGVLGVSEPKLTAFFEEARALGVWWSKGESTEVLPLAEKTEAAHAALARVREKIEDYFLRCRLAAFDTRATQPLNRSEEDYARLGAATLSAESLDLKAFPLARAEAGRALPLDAGVNPAWADAMLAFKRDAVVPLLGERAALGESDFASLASKLGFYDAWLREKPLQKVEAPTTGVEKLGKARVREILGSSASEEIASLIAQDKALEPEANAIAGVEKLVRFHRDLHKLLCNFVSFRDFYSNKGGVFQAGTLFLDGRSCDLCIRVDDAGTHSGVATLGNIFLVYCECKREATKEHILIVAALTAGGEQRVRVGRHGVFYDRRGNDWDATVVKVTPHPISIHQAFWLPYQRIGAFIGEQIEKFAAEHDKAVHEKAAAHVVETKQAAEAEAVAATPAPTMPVAAPVVVAPVAEAPAKRSEFDAARFAGILAAVGLAIGAIGSVLVAVAAGFLNLKLWQMPLAFGGVILAISGPSMIIAYVKLRTRNLGPILDGAGWAVNAQAKINIPFGASLTQLPALPPNAERSLTDPYAEKNRSWIVWVIVVIAIAFFALWRLGYMKPWLVAIWRGASGAS